MDVQYRKLQLDAAITDDAKMVIASVSLSSELPVDRWFGREVLDHSRGAINLERVAPTLPLLFNHDPDHPVGVVENVRLDGKRLRGDLRFFDTRNARDVYTMVSQGLQGMSIGYQVDKLEAQPDDIQRATRWTLVEASIAPVAADHTVGVGRSLSKGKIMEKDDVQVTDPQPLTRKQRAMSAGFETGVETGVERGREEEYSRILGIKNLCKRIGVAEETAERFVRDGRDIEYVRAYCLDWQQSQPRQRPLAQGANIDFELQRDLGMSQREVGEFSIVNGIRALVNNNWQRAGLEREASEAVAKRLGRESAGFFVPLDVQRRGDWLQRAPYAVGATGTGGALVATQLLSGSFIESLRNSSFVMQAGATVLAGLVGKVDVPRRTATTTTYWVAESTAITEAEATFDKVSLTPKTIGALSKMSRLTLLQTTPDIESVTRRDLALQIGLGVDLAALSGSGAGGQPTGIANTAGIGTVVGGTNGANITLDFLVAAEAAIANANAPLESRAYFLNTKAINTLKNLKATTNQYLWTSANAVNPGQRSGTPPSFNGYPVYATNQLRSNLTKGTAVGICSEFIFGDWSELLIGEWGALEILANPYDATGFTTGDVLIRALMTLDIQVRHPVSFAYSADMLTP